MNKLFTIFFLFFVCFIKLTFGQENLIESKDLICVTKSGKIINIKPEKRIVCITDSEVIYGGKYHYYNQDTLLVGVDKIPIKRIKLLKRNQLSINIIGGAFIVVGALGAINGIVILLNSKNGTWDQLGGVVLTIPSLQFITYGILFTEIKRKLKIARNNE